MQALIDFDGWRKWSEFATENGLKGSSDRSNLGKTNSKKAVRGKSSPVGGKASTHGEKSKVLPSLMAVVDGKNGESSDSIVGA
jgi:hypothetical protein